MRLKSTVWVWKRLYEAAFSRSLQNKTCFSEICCCFKRKIKVFIVVKLQADPRLRIASSFSPRSVGGAVAAPAATTNLCFLASVSFAPPPLPGPSLAAAALSAAPWSPGAKALCFNYPPNESVGKSVGRRCPPPTHTHTSCFSLSQLLSSPRSPLTYLLNHCSAQWHTLTSSHPTTDSTRSSLIGRFQSASAVVPIVSSIWDLCFGCFWSEESFISTIWRWVWDSFNEICHFLIFKAQTWGS